MGEPSDFDGKQFKYGIRMTASTVKKKITE